MIVHMHMRVCTLSLASTLNRVPTHSLPLFHVMTRCPRVHSYRVPLSHPQIDPPCGELLSTVSPCIPLARSLMITFLPPGTNCSHHIHGGALRDPGYSLILTLTLTVLVAEMRSELVHYFHYPNPDLAH